MRIEIFVVRSAKEDSKRLELAKEALIELYDGLTIIPNCCGYWKNKKGLIETDNVEIWLICFARGNKGQKKARNRILHEIRVATHQKTQFWIVNNKPNLKIV